MNFGDVTEADINTLDDAMQFTVVAAGVVKLLPGNVVALAVKEKEVYARVLCQVVNELSFIIGTRCKEEAINEVVDTLMDVLKKDAQRIHKVVTKCDDVMKAAGILGDDDAQR